MAALSDPIGDMLTRIRNASNAKHDSVSMPTSKIKKEIAKILTEEGYVSGFEEVKGDSFDLLKIDLKYKRDKQQAITGIRRISKPGLRVYVRSDQIPKVLSGLGESIISSSKGVMTGKKAQKDKVGGEVICYIW